MQMEYGIQVCHLLLWDLEQDSWPLSASVSSSANEDNNATYLIIIGMIRKMHIKYLIGTC